MVSVLSFYSNDPSSNPADVYLQLFCVKMKLKIKKRLAHFKMKSGFKYSDDEKEAFCF